MDTHFFARRLGAAAEQTSIKFPEIAFWILSLSSFNDQHLTIFVSTSRQDA